MPRKEMDYSKTHFYKIVCRDVSIKDCYVGHTLNFKNRKSAHKTSHYNSNGKTYNGHLHKKYLYDFIDENGGWENWDMILISTERCENALEARKRERELIEEQNATLNKIRPYRSLEEMQQYKQKWAGENSDKMKQVKSRWYERNKEEKSRKSSERILCECGCEVCQGALLKHKQTKKHQDYINSLQD